MQACAVLCEGGTAGRAFFLCGEWSSDARPFYSCKKRFWGAGIERMNSHVRMKHDY